MTVKRSIAVLAFFLVACSPAHSPVGQRATPTPIASTAPSMPVPAPTPGLSTTPNTAADLPVTSVDFACRLPVVTRAGAGGDTTLQGGFLTFPAAQLTNDPGGTIRAQSSTGDDYATSAAPVLLGFGSNAFYDRAQSRWVPASPSQARPDGGAYAYVSTGPQGSVSKAHVVDVASGDTRAFDMPPIEGLVVGDYAATGVYLLSFFGIGGPGKGVWLLDPATGKTRQLRDIKQVWAVRDGYAWVPRLDPRDKTVWPPMEIAPEDSLVRIDLATGAETTWFYEAGRYPWMIGFTSRGQPVVVLGGPSGNEFRVMDQPGSPGQLIYSGNGIPLGDVQGDGDRIWFGSQTGIYLYRPDRGFQKVFAYTADPANFPYIRPAGFCL